MRATTRGAVIVVDLGFGDAGKGLMTDHLVRRLGARAVVRWNGGAQAGHNVVTPDGRHHTFAQIGAGAFVPGVATFLTRDVVVHPTGLGVEAEHLAGAGVRGALERVSVSADARVITPFQQAAGRLRELARGAGRHGSCGVGVGETVGDSIAAPDAVVRVGELVLGSVRAKLVRLRDRKRAELDGVLRLLASRADATRESALFDDAGVVDRWLEEARSVLAHVSVVDEPTLAGLIASAGRVILEGAQGVLLDEWRGFHPFTTWSTCTTEPARALVAPAYDAREVSTLGVLRTFATRHGPGPFPTEDAAMSRRLGDAHNVDGPWQGPLRIGRFDAVLGRYALAVSGGVDALALTHLDALPRLDAPTLCRGYQVGGDVSRSLAQVSPTDGTVVALRPSPTRDLVHQGELTRLVGRVTPLVSELGASDVDAGFIAAVEESLEREVAFTSHGPTSAHVRARPSNRAPGGWSP